MKNNQVLRKALKKQNILQWQAAEALGIHESCLSRLLRKELPISKQKELIKRIKASCTGGKNA